MGDPQTFAVGKVPHHHVFVAIVGDPDGTGGENEECSREQKKSRPPANEVTAYVFHRMTSESVSA